MKNHHGLKIISALRIEGPFEDIYLIRETKETALLIRNSGALLEVPVQQAIPEALLITGLSASLTEQTLMRCLFSGQLPVKES